MNGESSAGLPQEEGIPGRGGEARGEHARQPRADPCRHRRDRREHVHGDHGDDRTAEHRHVQQRRVNQDEERQLRIRRRNRHVVGESEQGKEHQRREK